MPKTHRVLVIDDRKDTFDYLSDFIPLIGQYVVEHAPTLIHALAMTNAFEPEVIVFNTEIKPAEHAHYVLSEIRRKHEASKVIALAADETAAEALRKAGLTRILAKPFDMTDLSQRVKELLPPDGQADGARETARLLIADDEHELAEYMAEFFSELGLEVFKAGDGESAFEIFSREKCNLAIVDLNMPKVSGRKLIDMMRAHAKPPRDIIVIGAVLGESVYELRRMGCDLIEKPVDMEELKKLILEDCEKFRLVYQKREG